jgi:hypothetical protein
METAVGTEFRYQEGLVDNRRSQTAMAVAGIMATTFLAVFSPIVSGQP